MDQKKNEEFEKVNQEWCDQVKEDMRKRQEVIQDKEQRAVTLRIKGNNLFRRKQYTGALAKYCEALSISPFSVNILTNIAIVHEKTNGWDEAVEFCDRAIHIDKACSKALFLRHKALLQLQDEYGALRDINECISIDPQNKIFRQCLEDLALGIKNAKTEADVTLAVKEKKKFKTNSSDGHTGNLCEDFASLSPEKLFFIVTEKENSNYNSMVQKQCQYVEEFRNIFGTHGIGLKLRTIYPFLSMGKDITLFNLFVSAKLLKCHIACAYMRTSGYMSSLVQQLKDSFQLYGGWKTEEKDDTLEILSFVTKVMKTDVPMRTFIADVSLPLRCFCLLTFSHLLSFFCSLD